MPSGPATGWVSVWVGDYTDELDIDGYLGPAFRRDHRCQPHENAGYNWRSGPTPLAELLAEFSQHDRWVPALVTLAEQSGVASACCALVYIHYHHTDVAPPNSPLRFVGSVQIAPAT